MTTAPADLNLPAHFPSFRDGQLDLIMRLLASEKRVTMLESPTGTGKSLCALGVAANWHDGRCVVLTATKGLQDQIQDDFGGMSGFADVRGQSNYPCVELYKSQGITVDGCPECHGTGRTDNHVTGEIECSCCEGTGREHILSAPVLPQMGCDNGPCKTGWNCELKQSGCYYYDAWGEACDTQIISTNYAYWMGITNYGRGLGDGKIGLLILDEGHDADKMIRGFMSVTMGWQRVDKISLTANCQRPLSNAPAEVWADWAGDCFDALTRRLELAAQGGSDTDLSDMRENCNRCGRLAKLAPDWWFESSETYGIKASPSVVDGYAERYLFRNIPRIIVMSGTLRPEMAGMLGIKESECEYITVPSTFPKARRPIYAIPTIVANHRATESDWRTWLNRIDTLIQPRVDRKGIIHTVSYQRARFVKANSRFADLMLMHESGETQQAVERFKNHNGPLILLSPSIVTGFDFPDDQCRYQIMAKLPYPDTRSGPEAILNKKIKGYTSLVVAMLLSQAYGRGVRSIDDQCETFIIDDSIKWFLKSYNHLLPKYVLEAFRKVECPPPPMELDLMPVVLK